MMASAKDKKARRSFNEGCHRAVRNLPVVILFFALTFVFLTRSPLHPWHRGDSGTDSSVFRTVGRMMQYGSMPYRDSFDHKGPLVYIINYIGEKLMGSTGIWMLEYLILWITMILLYMTAREMKIERALAVVSTLTGFSLIFDYFDGGNLVEEYSLVFLAAALYIFCSYIVNRQISRLRLFLCGWCLGGVLLLRVNMAALWVVFCIFIFFRELLRKEYKALGRFTFWFVAGLLTSLLPILVWLWKNGALNDFWRDYIQFNLRYASTESGRVLAHNRWNAFFHFFNPFVCTASAIIGLFLFWVKDRFLYGSLLGALLLNLMMISLSGRTYGHYGMILVPVVTVIFAGFFSWLEEEPQNCHGQAVLAAGFLLCYIIAGQWTAQLQTAETMFENRGSEHGLYTIQKICDVIQQWSSEEDKISVFGNYNVIYLESQRQHATQFSYQFPIFYVDPSLEDAYWKQMQEELPKLLILTKETKDEDRARGFIEQNYYFPVWSGDVGTDAEGYTVYYLSDASDSTGKRIDLQNNPGIEMSNAEVVEDQYKDLPGIVCRGSLDRSYLDAETLGEYLRDHDYTGFKYVIKDITPVHVITFYGRKIKDHGQPSVYIYNETGNIVREFLKNYKNIDDTWKLYSIDVADLEGKMTIVFNGGYTDRTGNEESEFVFSNIVMYQQESIE